MMIAGFVTDGYRESCAGNAGEGQYDVGKY